MTFKTEIKGRFDLLANEDCLLCFMLKTGIGECEGYKIGREGERERERRDGLGGCKEIEDDHYQG